MKQSLILKEKCPYCGAVAVEAKRSEFLDDIWITLTCGHSIVPDKVKGSSYDIISEDGRAIRPFQIEGIKFAEQSNVRCLIGDEMGLGKTVQALGILKLHPEIMPCLIVCKAALMFQWFGETIRWCGHEYLPQMITSSKTKIVPGFPVYIISYDLLRRLSKETKQTINVKTVILDECQKIKNHLSIRAKEVQLLCKDVKHIIALSGTPVMNNAGEYFTVLNLLQPITFPYYATYIRDFCDAYDNGWSAKVGGLRNADYFHELTKSFIIRRTRSEVAPELPAISRNFLKVELQQEFTKAYDKAQNELEDVFYNMESDKDDDGTAMLSAIEMLTKLRHIVGWNKIKPTVDFTEDFLLDTNRKITIFAHHLDVTSALIANLKEMLANNNLGHIKIAQINAQQDMEKRHSAVTQFQNDNDTRICVASTLAAGEGLNMQFCADCIIMERQWTPAIEEQVEGRFIRIGQNAESVTATYPIALGTIDEFFTELVEQKRAIVSSTLDNKEIQWSEQSLMKDLLEIVAMKGGKRWKLK